MNKKKISLILILGIFISSPVFGNPNGFQIALPDRAYQFPRDHGAHPEYKIEWWYYTGQLQTADGRIFGFQWTLFRNSLAPEKQNLSNDTFDSSQLYLGHAALTDVGKKRFLFAERKSRGYFNDSHASLEKLDVQIQDWSAVQTGDSHQVKMKSSDFAYDLQLTPKKPLVIHGEKGVSRKGKEIANASHYLSYTRMDVNGMLTLEGQTLPVKGQAWMDHEFSSSQLDAEAVGWDWFSIQLSNQEEVMLYVLRDKNRNVLPYSAGTWIDASGKTKHLTQKDFSISILENRVSSQSKINYPSLWNISIPSQNLILKVKPAIPDQELDTKKTTGVTYFEGLTEVTGTQGIQALSGHGYVELTGYQTDLKGKI